MKAKIRLKTNSVQRQKESGGIVQKTFPSWKPSTNAMMTSTTTKPRWKPVPLPDDEDDVTLPLLAPYDDVENVGRAGFAPVREGATGSTLEGRTV